METLKLLVILLVYVKIDNNDDGDMEHFSTPSASQESRNIIIYRRAIKKKIANPDYYDLRLYIILKPLKNFLLLFRILVVTRVQYLEKIQHSQGNICFTNKTEHFLLLGRE